MSEITTLIRFENAWMTGYKLEPGITLLARVGFVTIEKVVKNEKGDGYFVSGRIDIKATLKERDNDA